MPTYGFCHLPAAPLRKEPSDASEMVSQLLFGECFRILGNNEKWACIENLNDAYRGYLGSKQYIEIGKDEAERFSDNSFVSDSVLDSIMLNGNRMLVPMGSHIPLQKTLDFNKLKISHNIKRHPASLLETARKLLNSPYLWGGKTCMGIDCSGFTQTVFSTQGVKLKRDASQQVTQGAEIASLKLACPGDLCFFDNAEGKIIHVGILCGDGEIIHASGCVRIDTIDENGILNRDTRNYTHHLAKICRIQPFFR